MSDNKENECSNKIMIKTSALDLQQPDNFDDFSINAFCKKVVVDPNPAPLTREDSDSKIRIPLRTLNLNLNVFNDFPPTSEDALQVS